MGISIKAAATLLSAMALAVNSIAAADEVGVARDSIKIGVFGPMSGAAELFGKSVFGIESVYKDINDKGGACSNVVTATKPEILAY